MHPPPQIEKSWKTALEKEWEKPYLESLAQFLAQERAQFCVFPPKQEVFKAFEYCPFEHVNVVIIGQDPYHGANQAHGLSFSVQPHIPLPPSLKNIFKELEADLGIHPSSQGSLLSWAKQGVLLLNNVLTVRSGEPGSHRGQGWELFTDAVVRALSLRKDPVIFVLWGKDAATKCKTVADPHFILTSPHPSPFSAHQGFFGSRPFSKINDLLKKQGKEPINWSLQ